MRTSRASKRGLALAAFLPFAAALFVVGPAEASRTMDARSSLASIPAATLAPSSSRELATLELSPLEPLEPADSASVSSRLGFAEDLSLLDVEACPCGFELFGGVGTKRCVLTYARNNPLKYVDPDGRMALLGYAVRRLPGGVALARKWAIRSWKQFSRTLHMKQDMVVDASIPEKTLFKHVNRAKRMKNGRIVRERSGNGLEHYHIEIPVKEAEGSVRFRRFGVDEDNSVHIFRDTLAGALMISAPWEAAGAADDSQAGIPDGFTDSEFTGVSPDSELGRLYEEWKKSQEEKDEEERKRRQADQGAAR